MNFQKLTLDNGMRLILVPKKESLATTVLVLVEAGSKYETKSINGLSHFLEHMVFRGTKKRPSERIVVSELDGLGASSNAFTGQEFTGYYTKVRNAYFDRALDIVSDVYLDPLLNPESIDKERGPIIEEINMNEDLPMRNVHRLFDFLLYSDQPAGWSILGTKENILRLKRNDFLEYRKKHYVAKATIVVIAGGYEDGVEEKVKRAFSGISVSEKVPKVSVVEKQSVPQSKIFYKSSDQTHLVLGFRAFDAHDKRRYALDVLADILGGGMSSRLFLKVRSELGAAYYVFAGASLYTDHGFFAVSAGVNHKRIQEVVGVILEECAQISNKGVDEEEIKKSKEHIIGNLFLSLETSDALGEFYGMQEIMKLSLESPRETAGKIEAVTAEEVRSVAKAIFKNDGLNLAVIGPFKEKSFSDILKI